MNHREAEALLNGRNMDAIRATITADNVNVKDHWGMTWLFTACMASVSDYGDALAHILDCGGLIDATVDFWTPLHYAVYNGKISCMRVLLARNAAIDPVSEIGNTPLFNSIRTSRRECAYLLLDHGAQLSLLPNNGIHVPTWATDFVAGRERARSASIHLMGGLWTKGVHRDLIPLIGQWVWNARGCK
jgi:hypothetical protein